MAKKASKSKSCTFKMDTKEFCILWMANLENNNNWEEFLNTLWSTFSKDSDNLTELTNHYKNLHEWNEKSVLEFLSPRAYAKCSNIRRKLKKHYEEGEHGLHENEYEVPSMPNGATANYGDEKKASNRMGVDALHNIFNKK